MRLLQLYLHQGELMPSPSPSPALSRSLSSFKQKLWTICRKTFDVSQNKLNIWFNYKEPHLINRLTIFNLTFTLTKINKIDFFTEKTVVISFFRSEKGTYIRFHVLQICWRHYKHIKNVHRLHKIIRRLILTLLKTKSQIIKHYLNIIHTWKNYTPSYSCWGDVNDFMTHGFLHISSCRIDVKYSIN